MPTGTRLASPGSDQDGGGEQFLEVAGKAACRSPSDQIRTQMPNTHRRSNRSAAQAIG